MRTPTWQQLVDWLKPFPASEDELGWMKGLRAGEYEVYLEKLNNICVEANTVLVRTGITHMLRSGDTIVGIYTVEGDLVTAHCGTYLHAVTGQLPVKFIMHNWKNEPTVGVREGDIFYANEALYGGIHNPDQMACMPIFHNGELIAWSVAAVHQPETGGCDPGGMCPMAKTRYDEGMKIVPMKVGENYRLREDMLEMMANMVGRAPRMQETDVRARFAGADRIRIRLQEVAKEKGKEFLKGLFRRIIEETDHAARERVRGWNDGVYKSVVFHDCVGAGQVGLVKICVTAHKEDDHITFDFAGTSPENYSSWHVLPHAAVAHAATWIYGYPFCDLPLCCGTLACMDWKFPEGIVLNPQPNAAVSNAPTIGNSLFFLMPQIFARMTFDSKQRDTIGAPLGGCGFGAVVFAGLNQWGVPFADNDNWNFNTQGQGGRINSDGINTWGFAWCNIGWAPDAEDVELDLPVLHMVQKQSPDSCGFGKFRGGSGGEILATLYPVPLANVLGYSTGGVKIPLAQGVFGGYPHSPHPFVRGWGADLVERLGRGEGDLPESIGEMLTKNIPEAEYEVMNTAFEGYVASSGDIVAWGTSGAPGYGDVLERDPEAVMKDIGDGIVSHDVAGRIFHVAYDPETLDVDQEKTEKLRNDERQKRLKQGKTYDEFIEGWADRYPDEKILEYYGSWPDAEPVNDIMRI